MRGGPSQKEVPYEVIPHRRSLMEGDPSQQVPYGRWPLLGPLWKVAPLSSLMGGDPSQEVPYEVIPHRRFLMRGGPSQKEVPYER